ncbi:MAG: M48 family metallopeptidase [Candidatus Liptonbacteria bacterium]|nr:M48 family metallopeptidase [Candidatus Liptonbacteria bacterium]
MATLYTQKSSNIRKTFLLFTVFFAVIIGLGFVFSEAYGNPSILYIAVVFSCFMSFLSYWQSDKIVLAMSKGVPVDRSSNRELYSLVENLSISAGLPAPKIYLTPELTPNAFATGRDPNHAVICVTRGLLQKLNKTELEGVLAHELSHIGNRDMLVNTVAVVLVGFISILANFFMRSMFFGGGRSRDNENSGAGIFMIIGIVLSILAPIVASLMQLAISRRREFLADTSGALLTRYPEGLASALEKISRDTTPMQFAQPATSHLWLADPMKNQKQVSFFAKLFMTHPPIEERIKILRGMSI